ERDVVTRASVVGKEFRIPELAALWEPPSGPPPGLGGILSNLVEREFVLPVEGGDGFSFRHVLIRDAAYETAPKRVRAELHARLAEWLDRQDGRGPVQLEEILGYHLERAYRYRAELAPVGDRERALAARASALLLSSGRRA